MIWILLRLFAVPVIAQQAPSTPQEFQELQAITTDMATERTGHARASAKLVARIKALKGPGHESTRQDLQAQLDALESHHASIMNDLLSRTMSLYRIRPSPPHGGVIVPGPFLGERVRWAPIYSPQRRVRRIERQDGTVMVLRAPGRYEAITWADGRVELTDEAFRNPAYLAAILLHESVHFEQYVTPGRGDRHGAVRLELEAPSRSSGQNTARILGLSADDVDRIHRIHTEQMEAFQRNPGQAMMWLQFAGADAAHDAALSDFEARLRDAEELARSLRPAWPTAPSPPEPMYPPASFVPSRAQPAPPNLTASRVASDGVRELVASACRRDWSAASRQLHEFSRLGPGDVAALGQHASSESEVCRKALLSRLVIMRQANESLDIARLQTLVQEALNPPLPDGPLDGGRGSETGTRGGVTPGDRPSQRGAERRLGDGWKGF